MSNIKLRAAPLVQHFSVFSAGPGLGYETLIVSLQAHWSAGMGESGMIVLEAVSVLLTTMVTNARKSK